MDTPSKHAPAPLSLLGNKADYLAAALLTSGLYLLAVSSYGPGITNDSVDYLSAASSINNGFRKSDGTPFFEWPPLFPILLAASKILNIGILTFATFLQGFTLTVNVLLTLRLLKKNLTEKSLLALSALLLICSTPLLQVHMLIWSEPVFILLLLLNLYLLEKYIAFPSLRRLLLLVLIGMLLCLQRKSGAYLIASTALILLLKRPRKTIHFLIYAFLSATPMIWWFTRRHALSGKYFGAASWEPVQFLQVSKEFLNTFTAYFLPSPLPLAIRVIAVTALAAAIIWLRIRNAQSWQRLRSNITWQLSVLFCFTYYLLLIISLVYIHISEDVDDRILSPVYLPLLLSVVIFADVFYSENKNTWKAAVIIPALLLLWTTYNCIRTGRHLIRWNTLGTGGYNSAYWQTNPAIQYLLQTDLKEKQIQSDNVHVLVYYLHFKNSKNNTILSAENRMMIENNALLVCFEKQDIISACIEQATGSKASKLILSSNEGKIWELKRNQR